MNNEPYFPIYERPSIEEMKDTWGIYRVHQFEKVRQFL